MTEISLCFPFKAQRDAPVTVKMQEIFPDSGVLLPIASVLNAYEKAEKDAGKLFHLLFQTMFKDEDLVNCVAFGGNCGIPEGKKLLDQKKAQALRGNYFTTLINTVYFVIINL